MIDYKHLRHKFTEKLSEFDKDKLQNWIEFDQNRTALGKLLKGENVTLQYKTSTPYKLTDKRESIDSSVEKYSYEKAS